MLAQGEGGYQTVTILPPESSTGEVSYVLIVQQPDGGEQAVISSEVLDGAEEGMQCRFQSVLQTIILNNTEYTNNLISLNICR